MTTDSQTLRDAIKRAVQRLRGEHDTISRSRIDGSAKAARMAPLAADIKTLERALIPTTDAGQSGEVESIVTGYRNMGHEGDKDAAIEHLCDIVEAQVRTALTRSTEDSRGGGEVCTGCGGRWSRAELDARGKISCCPERKMVSCGVKKVPVEPTEAMLDAACDVGPDTNNGAFSHDDAAQVWTAMLAAAPASDGVA